MRTSKRALPQSATQNMQSLGDLAALTWSSNYLPALTGKQVPQPVDLLLWRIPSKPLIPLHTHAIGC